MAAPSTTFLQKQLISADLSLYNNSKRKERVLKQRNEGSAVKGSEEDHYFLPLNVQLISACPFFFFFFTAVCFIAKSRTYKDEDEGDDDITAGL